MKQKKLFPLMLAGTGSDVGKSIIATALCRIFRQDGYLPAPFKAQNMALNSFVTPDGLEIGRAQAVQAEAAGIPCEADMNPLLLKPQSDHTSQVVLLGRPIGNKNAYDYWRRPSPSLEGTAKSSPFKEELEGVCHAAFDRLAQRFNPIVMEGAGSISELNLRDTDLVNMPMARYADARVLLVADIDRGGVFASAYGSIMLQSEADKQRIKGIIVNKFRGDMRLFDEGRLMLEDICGVPVLGVIPYLKDIHIEEEDSMDLKIKSEQYKDKNEGVVIAAVRLPYISNFTDFDVLEHDPRITFHYTDKPHELGDADIIILPGTKSTLSDLYWLHQKGLAEAILRAHREGKTIMGICGGFQMLGQSVDDPQGVEGDVRSMPGLGILPMTTTMNAKKTTRRVKFTFEGASCKGYEIHQGQSTLTDPVVVRDNCIGTYVHGILDNSPFVDFLLRPYADKVGGHQSSFDYQAYKQQQYDLLADHVRKHLDMERVYAILNS